MPLVRTVQEQLARSRHVAVGATRAARFLNGVTAYRLGSEVWQDKNGQAALIARVAPTVDRFVDVGANVGDWTAELLAQRPEAEGLLIEPGREAIAACCARFATRVIVKAAAGAAPGTLAFHEGEGADPHASAVVAEPGSSVRDVPVVTVAQAVSDRGWDEVDVVKIDAEGYDLRVLEGCRPLLEHGAVGLIQYEYNDSWRLAHSTLEDAFTMCATAGYSTWLVARGGLWDFPIEVYGEFYRHSDLVAVHDRIIRIIAPLIWGRA